MPLSKLYAFLLILGTISYSNSNSQYSDKHIVHSKIGDKALPFALSDVKLLAGSPFKRAMDLDGKYLLELSADRFLSRWRTNAGLPSKAPPYEGWESTSSHMLGHFLSACSQMYAATGDRRFLDTVNYIVDELAACQIAKQTGYIGGIPDDNRIWKEVAAGDIHSTGFDLNGAWVPWYMLHKVWAGLIDAYFYCDNKKAKEVVVKLSDWACNELKDLSEDKFQQMLTCEYGGMNESLAEVYAITGNKKYLKLANRFNQNSVLDPLSAGVDQLSGLHANTQIPKIIGCARMYELTADSKMKDIAEYFWNIVVKYHSYVIGGNSNYESFTPADKISDYLSTNTTETCNSYNMLKLTTQLFEWDPQAGYMDYYEKVLYNHILASQNPETGMMCYYVPLKSGTKKVFSTPFESFWCCVGTGIENHATYGKNIYFKGSDSSLYINLFIPSVLNWKERGVKVRQETKFPEDPVSTLILHLTTPQKFPLHIRSPYWAKGRCTIKINGHPVQLTEKPGTYMTLLRRWKDGDIITIEMPMSLRVEAMPDDPHKVAFLYGPLVLGGALGKAHLDEMGVPVLITNNKPVTQWVKPVSGTPLVFQTVNVGRPKDVILKPFYKIYNQYDAVYWDIFTNTEWQNKKSAYEAALKQKRDIEALTTDVIRLGEQQSEHDHDLTGNKTRVGAFDGHTYRDAFNGGAFSFHMKCLPKVPLALICTYYGSDGDGRVFDIFVDEVMVATEKLHAEKPEKFIERVYPISDSLTKEKGEVTITFKAHPGKMAGGCFGVRMIKKARMKKTRDVP